MMQAHFLSALFPSTAQARAAAERLERQGAVRLSIETESESAPQPVRPLRPWSDWILFALVTAFMFVLSFAVLCVPGLGYALALVALVTLMRVRPSEIEHRLLVRDETLHFGGAVLNVSPGPLRSQGIIR